MLPIQSLTPEILADLVEGMTLSEARKVVSSVHKGPGIGVPVRQVRRAQLASVRALCDEPHLRVCDERRSALDPFIKLVLETLDGHRIESVRIPLEKAGRFSVCVSSQIGCALACAFCATGRLGLRRNLETWEIVEQVRLVRATLDLRSERVHGVVFQGMGEPLANLDRVLQAIAVLAEPSAQSIDGRAITVCTAGIPSGIRRLASESPKTRLALSLGSAREETRQRLMPLGRSHSLSDIVDAAVEHARATSLAPLWALTLLAGVNDSDEEAVAMADLALRFTERAGVRPRLTIIPYNPIGGDDPFARVELAVEERYRDRLRSLGVPTHKRYSGGSDVGAACGQLAGGGS